MKRSSILLAILLSTQVGCSTWLRYQYERALTQLPDGARVKSISNRYIEYSIDTNTFKAYYYGDGSVYKVLQTHE